MTTDIEPSQRDRIAALEALLRETADWLEAFPFITKGSVPAVVSRIRAALAAPAPPEAWSIASVAPYDPSKDGSVPGVKLSPFSPAQPDGGYLLSDSTGGTRALEAGFAPAPPEPRREPMEHDLSLALAPFEALGDGSKTFEWRKADRDYRVGDTLHLREFIADVGRYTGRELRKYVTYVLRSGFGMPDGYCVMSLADADEPEPRREERPEVDRVEVAIEGWTSWAKGKAYNRGTAGFSVDLDYDSSTLYRLYADEGKTWRRVPAPQPAPPEPRREERPEVGSTWTHDVAGTYTVSAPGSNPTGPAILTVEQMEAAGWRRVPAQPEAPKDGPPPGVPRAACLWLQSPAEAAIRNARAAVEVAGCSPHLTDAIRCLNDAQDAVARFVDGAPTHECTSTCEHTACPAPPEPRREERPEVGSVWRNRDGYEFTVSEEFVKENQRVTAAGLERYGWERVPAPQPAPSIGGYSDDEGAHGLGVRAAEREVAREAAHLDVRSVRLPVDGVAGQLDDRAGVPDVLPLHRQSGREDAPPEVAPHPASAEPGGVGPKCEMIDVHPGDDGMGHEVPCQRGAVGVSEQRRILICQRHLDEDVKHEGWGLLQPAAPAQAERAGLLDLILRGLRNVPMDCAHMIADAIEKEAKS